MQKFPLPVEVMRMIFQKSRRLSFLDRIAQFDSTFRVATGSWFTTWRRSETIIPSATFNRYIDFAEGRKLLKLDIGFSEWDEPGWSYTVYHRSKGNHGSSNEMYGGPEDGCYVDTFGDHWNMHNPLMS
jgi:hypothetical protein